MTVEEKAKRIEAHCDGYTEDTEDCAGCPLFEEDTSACYERLPWMTDEDYEKSINNNYNHLFGDAVNHPVHYQGKHECIDEMIALFGVEAVISFCKCNVYKYRYRSEQKNGVEDIEKAEWYMDKLIELERVKNELNEE